MKTFELGEIVLVRDHLNTYTRCVYTGADSDVHWVTHINEPVRRMGVRDADITTQFDLDINALGTPVTGYAGGKEAYTEDWLTVGRTSGDIAQLNYDKLQTAATRLLSWYEGQLSQMKEKPS